MNWAGNLWFRLQSLGFVVCAGVVALGVALLFLPLLQQRRELHEEAYRLDQEIARQESVERKQQAEIDALRTDPSYVGQVIREKLNLARNDEVVFRFQPATVAAPTVQPRR